MLSIYNDSIGVVATPKAKTFIILRGVLFSLLFAAATGLLAKLRFHLPFTPVPVTGQVFAVLLSGLLLGRLYGPMSQVFYIGFGLLGVPWFSVFPLVPTGGYLAGFIAAPYVTALIITRVKRVNLLTTMLSLISAVLVIYVLGFSFFWAVTGMRFLKSVKLAILPFIPFDIVKAFLAASVFLSLKRIVQPKGLI
ncbi:MAG: biotin transporter BioY [Spirochaetota bacterium]|nr:MAG: biotin transporter BioY [Spirochaetota bacterium]